MESNVLWQLAYLYGVARAKGGEWEEAFCIAAKSFYGSDYEKIVPSRVDNFESPDKPVWPVIIRIPGDLAKEVEDALVLGGQNDVLAENVKAMVLDLENNV